MTHLQLLNPMIKQILLLIAVLVLISFTIPKDATKWVILQNSSLTINGSTNVNKFSCAIVSYSKADTITLNNVNEMVHLSGNLNLNVKNFECNNIMMTHQFRKTLKSDEYPSLHINFLSLKEFPNPSQKLKQVRGLVAIKIAGITKKYEINYLLEPQGANMVLRGSQQVNFSDFKLIPPHRVGKMIKAKDQLQVVFELRMRTVD